jgi:hypothetical protein
MLDLKKKLNKLIDVLSNKYDFLYLLITKKYILLFSIILYTAFIFFIIFYIYKADNFTGIVENIFPFFVDLFLLFVISLVVLFFRINFNDETKRLDNENPSNNKIIFKKFLNYEVKNAQVIIEKDFYDMSPLIENLLKWININKEDYFRVHFGSLDIPKITLKEINFDDSKIILKCGKTSFFNIAFTHYFADYKLSSSSSKENSKDNYTLRNLFNEIIKNYYKKYFYTKKVKLFPEFPNPLGITGIVKIKDGIKNYYLLQVRSKTTAASRNKIQWSFAGLIDIISKNYNPYESNINLYDFIKDEMDDEIMNKKISIDGKEYELFKYLNGKERKVNIIGILLNTLYLYQPEIFVIVEFDLDDLPNLEKEIVKKFLNKINISKNLNNIHSYNILSVDDLSEIEKHVINNENIKVRNIFKVGYEFLKHYEGAIK